MLISSARPGANAGAAANASPGARFRTALAENPPLAIVGAINPFCAMLAEQAGHQAIYLAGGGMATHSYGLPDLALTTMTEVLENVRRITDVTDVPLLVDVDTGFGGLFNIARLVRGLIKDGAAAMHIEDQVALKRCGHRPNKSIVSTNELIAYAKKNPGKLSYGTPNSATLVGMETFKRGAGVDITSVPYKASPQAMMDLVGNQIQVIIIDFAVIMPQVKAGKARALAVTMPKRSALLPDVPTLADTIKGFDISAWTGLLLPGKTPPALANRLFEAMRATLALPEIKEKLASIGFDIQPMGPEEFGTYLRDDIKRWNTLVKEAGIQPE